MPAASLRTGKTKHDHLQPNATMTPKEFFEFAKKNDAKMVDLKFTDLLGSWQHCSFPIETWDEGTFEDGVGFDGSSVRGWQDIHQSDMLAVPDASTAALDPFFQRPTVSVIANIVDPVTREDYTRDPRHVARKAEAHLRSTGNRRHVQHRAGAGVLHLRHRALRAERASRLLRDRLGGGRVEHGTLRGAEPGLQTELQGWLLPGEPDGHVSRSQRRDGVRR